MAEQSNIPQMKLYNTPLELGMRSLILLHTSNSAIMDLEKIMYLDYLCLNTSDLDGPKSLHAPIPNRGVQIFSKKDLIQKGLSIMITKDLVKLILQPNGFFYQITEAGTLFLDFFQTKYYLNLSERCKWVNGKWGSESTENIKYYIDNNIQKWGGDFLVNNKSDKL